MGKEVIQARLMLCVILTTGGCTGQTSSDGDPVRRGPFLRVEPGDEPRLLAPDLLASPAEEYNGTFSPDGTEFYYTTDIPGNAFVTFTRMLPDGTWTDPRVASFSGTYSDYDPIFSPDGSRLYFSSSRPLAGGENSKIYFVERTGDGWGEPERVVLTGEEHREYYSSVTRDGTIYFNIWSTGKIYKATGEGASRRVEELPPVINGDSDQGDPFIAPDEEYLIFRGYRQDGYGDGDLYISFKVG